MQSKPDFGGHPYDMPDEYKNEVLDILAYLVLTTGPIEIPSRAEVIKKLNSTRPLGLAFFKDVKRGPNGESLGSVMWFGPESDKDKSGTGPTTN